MPFFLHDVTLPSSILKKCPGKTEIRIKRKFQAQSNHDFGIVGNSRTEE